MQTIRKKEERIHFKVCIRIRVDRKFFLLIDGRLNFMDIIRGQCEMMRAYLCSYFHLLHFCIPYHFY